MTRCLPQALRFKHSPLYNKGNLFLSLSSCNVCICTSGDFLFSYVIKRHLKHEYVQFQKQPPEVFCKKRCSVKFRKFHRKTPALEAIINKGAGLQACNFIKQRLQQSYFLVKFAKFLRTPILNNICERMLLQFFSHDSMFIIYVTDLSTKKKMQRRGFIFLQKLKIQTVGNGKKLFPSVTSFQKILIFHICVSSENAQCFVGAFLSDVYKTQVSMVRLWTNMETFLLISQIKMFL